MEGNIAYYMRNAQKISDTLRQMGLEFFGGRNAPYLWVRTPQGMGSWQFFEAMLEATAVVCTPGVGFGPTGEGYVRLTAFGTHEQTDEALRRMVGWMTKK